jgi:hypothetical protein
VPNPPKKLKLAAADPPLGFAVLVLAAPPAKTNSERLVNVSMLIPGADLSLKSVERARHYLFMERVTTRARAKRETRAGPTRRVPQTSRKAVQATKREAAGFEDDPS